MKNLCIIFAFLSIANASAQEYRQPDGGGLYQPKQTECVSAQEYQRINAMLQNNIKQLKAEGILAKDWGEQEAQRPTNGDFIWPIKQQPGFNYNSVYGVSNYVDLNPLFPNQLLDWNCGQRTYDLTGGYNHGGIDIFLWPFSQLMQENEQVAIISATDGIVIGKDDGNFDKNCAMANAQWNAVYIGNTDGTICWYGHMKKNSLTIEAVGQSVSQGEFLGFVGSSGSSTGPHLHFEVHDVNANVVEPFSGSCNNNPSLWQSQKPYYEPAINTLLTHDARPVFPDCPLLETTNAEQYYNTGDSIFFASYLHDQDDSLIRYEIIQPSNAVFTSWNHQLQPGQRYTASWWYWRWYVSEQFPSGEWKFRATYRGNVVSTSFFINNANSLQEHLRENAIGIYPNPTKNGFTIEGFDIDSKNIQVNILSISGARVHQSLGKPTEGKLFLNIDLPVGSYVVQVTNQKGERQSGKLVIVK